MTWARTCFVDQCRRRDTSRDRVLMKGARSAEVARQYSGSAGRIVNARSGCSSPTPPTGPGVDRLGVVPAEGRGPWTVPRRRDRRRGGTRHQTRTGADDEQKSPRRRGAAVPVVYRRRGLREGRQAPHVTRIPWCGPCSRYPEVTDDDLNEAASAPNPRRDRRPARNRVEADQLRRRTHALRLGGGRQPGTPGARSRSLVARPTL